MSKELLFHLAEQITHDSSMTTTTMLEEKIQFDETFVLEPVCLQENQLIQMEENEDSDLDDAHQWDQLTQQLQLHIKRVLEALLFASSEPLNLLKIREIITQVHPIKPKQIKRLLEELKQDYLSQQRAYSLQEIAQGYVLRTHIEYAPYLELLFRQKRGEKLSPASTEVLAIIAYRQPITRPQIDAIRGVDSSGVIAQLLERGLIEYQGKLEAPGKPSLYGTTKNFLKHFGLKDLTELKTRFSNQT